jgi:probable rRNA maturation factor
MSGVSDGGWVLLSERGATSPVTLRVLNRVAARAFDVTGAEGGEISLVVCNDCFIAELNRDYRKEQGPTDVLSFSLRDGEQRGVTYGPLGDIVISAETAERQAREEGSGLYREFLLLFTHGLLHLLGYTHDQLQDAERMQTLTNTILEGVTEER